MPCRRARAYSRRGRGYAPGKPGHDRWRSVVAMQTIWSQPVAAVLVFSNDFAVGGTGQGNGGRLDAPGVSDGAEHRLLVIPPDPAQLEVAVPAQRAGGGRSAR
jgi:hypothetical protein